MPVCGLGRAVRGGDTGYAMADEKDPRAQRLAEALRANLRRRKSQARARDGAAASTAPAPLHPGDAAADGTDA